MNENDKKNFTYLNKLIHSGVKDIDLNYDILLDEDEKNNFSKGIMIDVDGITLKGNGHDIDAKGLTRIFTIKSKDITLQNIHFTNGHYYETIKDKSVGGGAIFALADTSVTIENCTFTQNKSNYTAGCIFNKGVMDIHDSIFKDNSANRICAAIFNLNKLKIDGCSFDNNYAPMENSFKISYIKSRGNVVNKGDLTINNCKYSQKKIYYFEIFKYISEKIIIYYIILSVILVIVSILLLIFFDVIYVVNQSFIVPQYVGNFVTISTFNFLIFSVVSGVITDIESKIREKLKKQGFDYFLL
ncbi:MAG: hypothetical protein Q4Q22_05035 [Methanosphaera sp.]|nr:hypothetical protein [Methanosphaera sp.]